MSDNLPNVLTIARVLAAPCVALVFLVFASPVADFVALMLFAIASATDWVDGWLARRWNVVSPVGRMLDPIADKAMVAIALAVLLGLRGMEALLVIPVAVILLRETLVAGLREYLAGATVVSVTALAKWKTTAQMVAIAVMFAAGGLGSPAVEALGLGLLWVAAVLTAVTGWDYFSKGLAYIREKEA